MSSRLMSFCQRLLSQPADRLTKRSSRQQRRPNSQVAIELLESRQMLTAQAWEPVEIVDEAAAFFERAANNGITEAAYNLGLIFENGLLGTPKQDEALLWYKIAADQGSPDAKAALASMMKALQIDQKDVDALVGRMQQINEQVKGRRAGPQANKAASVSSPVAPADRALVAQIQEYLMLSGAYEGPADGKMGPKTIAAIKNYQDKNGLAKDGQASQSLLSHMMGG